LNIVMGAATFGEIEKGARIADPKVVDQILDVFVAHGHSEIDNSRQYCAGTSEEMIGKIDWKSKGLRLGTKLLAIKAGGGFAASLAAEEIYHTYDDMKKHLLRSLKALNTDQLDTWYLHSPDRHTDYKITMKAVNDLHKEGYFKRFGISNFTAWEVAEIVTIARSNGYIEPTVYQGIYNAIHRTVEPELVPCLRKFGLSFYVFNPLGGGFFTGRYNSVQSDAEPGSRFDASKGQGQYYRARYFNEANFKALAAVQAVATKHNLTLPEVGLRWLSHHSQLKKEYGDGILIGASSVDHVKENLADLDKGPLPEEVVTVVNEGWEGARPFASKYHH